MDHLYSVYQPIFLLNSNEVYGYEALLRGPSQPAEMFLEAKRKNMLPQFDTLAINLAIRSFTGKRDEYLFINCHPLSFEQIDFKRSLQNAYSELSKRIVLEVTEHEQLTSSGIIKQKVRDLKELGLKIAIDDFGNGYTNLSLIELLEPDYIKLDRTLTKNIASSTKVQSLIAGLAQMADAIGVNVIAEGIENKEQLVALLESGIAFGQGWLLGKASRLENTRHKRRLIGFK